jgi:hypothetical protein
MRVEAASPRWRNRDRRRSPRVGSERQRPLLAHAGDDAPAPNPNCGTQAASDEHGWQREMIRLRRISLLLSVSLAALVARMVIDGPNLLNGLTGGLILVLLLWATALQRQGRRLQSASRPRPSGLTVADAKTGRRSVER